MKTSKIITISILAGFFVLLIILSCTLFNLKTIDIEFLAQASSNEVSTQDEISKAGSFKMGSNLLFTNFNQNIAKIEKECAEIRVVKVVKKFPNKLTVYVVEREKQVHIEGNDGYHYIFDEYLKITQKSAVEEEYQKYCEIKGFELPENLEVGGYLTNNNLKVKLASIIDGVYSAGRTPMSIMSSITLSENELSQDEFLFKFKSGAEMKIISNENLCARVSAGIDTYNSISQVKSASQLKILKLLVNTGSIDKVTISYREEW